jgi:hypothetical protein
VQTAGLLFQRGSIRDAQSKWRVGAGPVTAATDEPNLSPASRSRFGAEDAACLRPSRTVIRTSSENRT